MEVGLLRTGVEDDPIGRLGLIDQLKRCSRSRDLASGKMLHAAAIQSGAAANMYVASSLVDMYGKCRSMREAEEVFDGMQVHDAVAWNALIFGYAENGEGCKAVELFSRMCSSCCAPNALTFVAALKAVACTKDAGATEGMALHSFAAAASCEGDVRVANTLIHMYARLSLTSESRRVFQRMQRRSLVSWNALLFGYADNGEGPTALYLLSLMLCCEFTPPNELSFVAGIKACGIDLERGRAIHAEVTSRKLDTKVVAINSLIDFYAGCGSMVEAQRVFDEVPTSKRNPVTWNALMAGYSRHGNSGRVFELFHQMRSVQLQPDRITFNCVLSACSHAGLVDEGRSCFESMTAEYCVEPDLENYHCMVSLLCKANHLEEAVALVRSMLYPPNAVTWKIVLAACQKFGEVQLGRLAFESLLAIDDKDATAYVLWKDFLREDPLDFTALK